MPIVSPHLAGALRIFGCSWLAVHFLLKGSRKETKSVVKGGPTLSYQQLMSPQSGPGGPGRALWKVLIVITLKQMWKCEGILGAWLPWQPGGYAQIIVGGMVGT